MKNVLVLGFSVTAENPGFVEAARKSLKPEAGVVLHKIGLGGLQPYHMRHMLEEIFQTFDPDQVVAELATPAFRNFPRPPEDHQATVQALVNFCADRGVALCFFDMPRTDVDSNTDWVFAMHKAACDAHGLPYLRAPEDEGLLRDIVHTTPAGTAAYADALLELLEMPCVIPQRSSKAPQDRFGALLISQGASQELYSFSRGGYTVEAPQLRAGETITIAFGKPTRVCGISYLMGPRSGKLSLSSGSDKRNVSCYDQFCYYERFGAMMFDPQLWETVEITQLPDMPDTPLLKGEANMSERLGVPVHLFTLT